MSRSFEGLISGMAALATLVLASPEMNEIREIIIKTKSGSKDLLRFRLDWLAMVGFTTALLWISIFWVSRARDTQGSPIVSTCSKWLLWLLGAAWTGHAIFEGAEYIW